MISNGMEQDIKNLFARTSQSCSYSYLCSTVWPVKLNPTLLFEAVEFFKMFQRLTSFFGNRNREQSQSEVKRRRLQELINHICKEEAEIISEDIKPRSIPGKVPYIFELNLKVQTISGTIRHFNWMIKSLQQDPKAPITKRYDVQTRLKKEMDVCNFIFDEVDKYQKRVSAKNAPFSDLFPTFFGRRINLTQGNERPDRYSIIIYQNLEAADYNFENACKGFDLLTTQIAVQNLAQLHAIPMAMRLKNMLQFKESVLYILNEIQDATDVQDYYKLIHKQMRFGLDNHPELQEHMDDIQTWIELSQRYSWMSKVYETLDWFTVCHPRYSIRNIMVHRDNAGKPIHSKVMEPHRFEFNSSAKDLVYFMFTSVETDVLRTHFDQIISTYFETFKTALINHNVEPNQLQLYTFERFVHEFNAMGPYMLADILYTLRTIICEEFDEKGDPILGETYRQKFKDIILLMIEKEWIRKIPKDTQETISIKSDSD